MSKAVKVAAAEIRAAKKWLEQRSIPTKEFSPKKFATAAKTLDKSFLETLKVIAGEDTGGQV